MPRATVGGSRKLAGALDEPCNWLGEFLAPSGPSCGSSISLACTCARLASTKGSPPGAWGIGFGPFLFFGMLSVDVSRGIAFVLAALGGAAIFLFVRINGDDERRRETP